MFMDEIEKYIDGEIPGFLPGKAISLQPENNKISIEITTKLGEAQSILMGLLFTLSKDGFKIEKVVDEMEVSPSHAQYYALVIKQKQELENQIKAEMASFSNALAELELLEHDLRKYKEFMNYFEEIEEGKKEGNKEKVLKATQTLKSIFIDQVDVHTGEGIALKLITPRWPTIIVDFMSLDETDVEPSQIAKKLNITQAEAVVLATKNKLFLEWLKMFRETVENRYNRLKSLVEAKRKSIEEIKRNLRPLLFRYRSIKEIGESIEGRKKLLELSWLKPNALAVSLEITKFWAWRDFEFYYGEAYKPSEELSEGKVTLIKSQLPKEFKEWFINEYGIEEAKKTLISNSPTNIEPLDFIAFSLIFKLQKYYKDNFNFNLNFTPKEILDIREEFFNDWKTYNYCKYFRIVECDAFRIIIRMPNGIEYDDITFDLRAKLETCNITILRYFELKVREKLMESYIEELLGESKEGKKIEEIVKEEYPTLKKFEKKEKKKFEFKVPQNFLTFFESKIPIFKPLGPYEVNFQDRLPEMLKQVATTTFVPYMLYIKKAVGVPG